MEKKPFQPAEYGFVLTIAQIDTYLQFQNDLYRANQAAEVDFNLKKFRAATASNALDEDSDD